MNQLDEQNEAASYFNDRHLLKNRKLKLEKEKVDLSIKEL